MKLLLRMSNQSVNIFHEKIKNTFYNSKNPINMLIYPLPEFNDNEKPKCYICKNNDAILMDKNFRFICNKCFNDYLGDTIICSVEESKIPNIDDFFSKQRIQWCLAGRDNWYSISGKNIIPDSTSIISSEELERRYHNLIERLLNGNVETLDDADYDKDKKTMKIYL